MQAGAAMFCASAGPSRAMSGADDLHGVRADDVGTYGDELAYIASDQPSLMWKGPETLHRFSEPGDGGSDAMGRPCALM